jgi:riboflavin kinase/FMN adenylyltransferase
MKYLENIEAMQHTCVAFGTFDGVHLGHQAVIDALVNESRVRGCTSVVVSFCEDSHTEVLTTQLEKAFLLEKMGVDVMISLPSREIDAREAVRLLDAKLLVTGQESSLFEKIKQLSLPVKEIESVRVEGRTVTTDRAIEALEAGDLKEFEAICGHPYLTLGRVVHGRALGRTVGMPTANQKIYGTKRCPPLGVYGTWTHLGGETYLGVTNVGTRPSVDERPEITVETMLLDFDREIYGEELITEYPLYLRGIQKFDGIEAVWKQVQKDIKVTKEKLMRGVET